MGESIYVFVREKAFIKKMATSQVQIIIIVQTHVVTTNKFDTITRIAPWLVMLDGILEIKLECCY